MKKRLVICYILLTVLLVAGLEIYLSLFVRRHYITELEKDLLIRASVLKDILPEKGFGEFCRRYKGEIGARVTVISETGNVLCDSDRLATFMDNHSNRPEIKDAMLTGKGSAIRYSSTLKKRFLYTALLVERTTSKMVIRLSIPLDRVESDIARVRIPVIVSTLFVIAVISFIWAYQSGRLRREIREVMEFSDSIVAGGKKRKVFVTDETDLGKLAGHVVKMADELERRLNEVKREKQTLEAVLKNMQEGIMIIDQRNSVLLVNDSLRDLLGITIPDDISASEALRDAELISMMDESRYDNKIVSKEILLRDGRYLYVTTSPVEISKNKMCIIMTFHEITRLKRLEQVRKDFVANVAHEIKTPITAIKGFAETLLDGALDDRDNAIKFLEIIKRHSERLNSLVSDLLTLSAIEQGEVRLEIAEVNLDEVIDSVFSLMEEKARAKGLYLKRSLQEGSTCILADRDKLFQILLNLIDNGIKFTESGGVTVGIDRNDPDVFLFVEDTGIGIEKRHLHRLGERFYRVDRARSRELGGTGLGLAIVKHLVKAHGWDMKIESMGGRGTKVMIIMRGLAST